MASIFPVNGVPAASANNAFVQQVVQTICSARYYSTSCAQTLDVDALNALISEMAAVVDQAGLPWDCNKLTNLHDALAYLIALGLADIGAGMPIFPETITNAGIVGVTPTTGQVVVNPSQTWVHRGLVTINTDDISAPARTLATVLNKTYHLRWHPRGLGDATPEGSYPFGRFVLKDLADVAYNPSALAETNSAFDSTYDDMLIAKVVTNGSNVPTVTSLLNKHRLVGSVTKASLETSANVWSASPLNATLVTTILNWARQPRVIFEVANSEATNELDAVNQLYSLPTRYSVQTAVWGYNWGFTPSSLYISGAYVARFTC